MQYNGFLGGYYHFSIWIMRLAYLNLLWLCFTILGLLVFGIAPATASLFSVQRKWLMNEKDIPIFKTFWTTYKREFIKTNNIWIIILLFGYFLYVDFQLITTINGLWKDILLVCFIIMSFSFFVTLIYIFPVYAHFELKSIKQYIKSSFFIGISQLPYTMIIVAGIILLFLLLRFIPLILPLFGMSLLGYLVSWSTHQSIRRIEESKRKMVSNL